MAFLAKKRFKTEEHRSSLETLINREQRFLLDDLSEESISGTKKKGQAGRNFAFIWERGLEQKKVYFIGMLLVLCSPLCHTFAASILRPLVEKGLLPKDVNLILGLSALYIFIEVLAFLFMWQGRKIMALASSQTLLSMRQKLFTHLQELPLSYLDRQPQGRIVTRLTHDVENLDSFFTEHLARFFSSFLTIFVAILAMIFTHAFLGMMMVVSALPVLFFIWITRKKVDNSNRLVSAGHSSINSKLSEFLSGMPVIRSYGLERWSIREFEKSVEAYMQVLLKANHLYAFVRPMASFFCSLPLLTLIGYGGNLVMSGEISLGLFLVFVRYYEIFYGPVLFLAHEVHTLQEAFTSAERLRLFLLAPTESFELGEDGKIDKGVIKGEIVFDQVSMGYLQKNEKLKGNDRDWALRQVSFKIKKGERIGLVGRTGCGKSTTVSLLSRLYAYQQGNIFIDGIKIENYKRSFLRQNIGPVSQDPILFKGTLRENLMDIDGLFPPKTKEEIDKEIIFACEQTGLFEILQKTKMTLDSDIKDGGVNLGQGEKQLINLTRILIKNPSILILDEATANIDPFYEEIVHRGINKIMEGRTCLFIAHRLSTLKDCQRIFVFDQGQLVEEGSEGELLSKKGFFYRLYLNAQENPEELSIN